MSQLDKKLRGVQCVNNPGLFKKKLTVCDSICSAYWIILKSTDSIFTVVWEGFSTSPSVDKSNPWISTSGPP